MTPPPTVAVEVQVDFSDYVPGGFGTCDCCIIGGDLLSIVDYKHGKGVPVSAVGNPQMRLYALGALHRYAPVFGDTIKRVRMTIDQPRLDSYTTDEITVDELRAWGEHQTHCPESLLPAWVSLSPVTIAAFCRGKAQCRARANINTVLEDFKDCVPAGKTAPGVRARSSRMLKSVTCWNGGKLLVQWYKDLEEYATEALLAGKEIPGWKLVAGRSNRTFTDQDAAIQAVIAAGYDEALVYDRKPKTLTELEKLMGKADFKEKIGSFVYKPPGKPTLAPASDKRGGIQPPAATDFAGVGADA